MAIVKSELIKELKKSYPNFLTRDLNKVIEISPTDKVALQDKECLNALMNCSLNGLEEGKKRERIRFVKAVQAFSKLISYENNENLSKLIHKSSV